MRHNHRCAAGLLAALSLLVVDFNGSAAAAPPAVKIDDAITLGEHWYGPKLTKEDLKGRVVLYEFWGLK